MKVIKVSAILNNLEEDGWYLVRTRGSHRQFKHPTKKGKVTVNGLQEVYVHWLKKLCALQFNFRIVSIYWGAVMHHFLLQSSANNLQILDK